MVSIPKIVTLAGRLPNGRISPIHLTTGQQGPKVKSQAIWLAQGSTEGEHSVNVIITLTTDGELSE